MTKRNARQIEFGDFQTPRSLAEQVVSVLKARGVRPSSVVEPTCGQGSFVQAAIGGFESAQKIMGLEINPDHFALAQALIIEEPRRPSVDLRLADFFSFNWREVIKDLPQPVLFLGNPPWVTSAGLGVLGSSNSPRKSNFQGHDGIDAITGKGNFDIAEWIVIKLLEAATGQDATLAMLVKTATARRVLNHAWQCDMPIQRSAVYRFDAAARFDVSTDACLFVCDLGRSQGTKECDVFQLDEPTAKRGTIAKRNGSLVPDAISYDRLNHLVSRASPVAPYRWRSGIKHDCSAIMELRRTRCGTFLNGLHEEFRLEDEFVFPMMKGSGVAGGRRAKSGDRWMIVPQKSTGDDTSQIREAAPETWSYLIRHGAALDQRGSSIYRKRPRFAVFGVGPYTFAPWKVAICGLYKRIEFALVGPIEGKPTVFDDTVYHLSFGSETDARIVAEALNSDTARELLNALIFWDAKRPITVDVLGRLNLPALLHACGHDGSFLSPDDPVSQDSGLLWAG